MPTKINTKTVTQYERIGCGVIDNRDGHAPSISFQAHWVEDDAEGIAQFKSVSRNLVVTYNPARPDHVAVFNGLRAIGIAALEA